MVIKMNIPEKFIRPFPSPEEVFSEEIERHAKHFLPICSLNLQFIRPDSEEFWIHFVQPAEIHSGCVGEHTSAFHDRYNFEDSICFDVDENGKYRFNGDWRFFILENKEMPSEIKIRIMEQAQKIAEKQGMSFDQVAWYKTPHIYRQDTQEELENVYRINHLCFNAIKNLYLKYGKFLQGYVPIELDSKYTLEELVALKEAADSQCQDDGSDRDLIEDVGGLSEGMLEEGFNHIDEMFQEEYGNLVDTPKRDDGKVFSYVGYLSGYKFQEYGCDELYLFFDADSKKAVVRLVYS